MFLTNTLLKCKNKISTKLKVLHLIHYCFFVFQIEQQELEREIRRRIQLQQSNELAIKCRQKQKVKELEEEEEWRAKMLIQMEKVRLWHNE